MSLKVSLALLRNFFIAMIGAGCCFKEVREDSLEGLKKEPGEFRLDHQIDFYLSIARLESGGNQVLFWR